MPGVSSAFPSVGAMGRRNCLSGVALLVVVACFAGSVLSDETGPVYVARAEALTQAVVAQTALPTVTVRGFLNFRTTVDGTVIVFTPASDAAKAPPTASQAPTHKAPQAQQTTNVLGFEIVGGANEVLPPPSTTTPPPALPSRTSTRAPVRTTTSTSRATSSRAAATARSNAASSTSSRPQYPTGLVTVLGGTHVNGGATTIHETKVIGTYIDGKYAQILQSTSRIMHASSSTERPTQVRPTPAFKAPEPTPAASLPVENSRKPELSPSPRQQQVIRDNTAQASKEERIHHRPRKYGVTSSSTASSTTTASPSSTVLRSSFRSPEVSSSRLFPRRTQSLPGFKTSRFRGPQSSESHSDSLDENTIVVTRSRLNHRSGSAPPGIGGTRLRYVPARNTHTVRLNRFKVRLTARPDQLHESDEPSSHPAAAAVTTDMASPSAHPGDEDVDPLVSIDPARVRYEQTTVTSLVTLHVGQGKSVVRTLTLTTSVARTLEPSELFSNGILEGSESLNAITATAEASEQQTPPLVVSRVYSTTEHSWRTSLVPIFDGLATTTHTLTESFIIRKIVTAYRTMPPGDLLGLDERNVTLDLDSEQYFQTLLQGNGPPAPTPLQQLQSPSSPEASYLALPSDGNRPVQLANPLLNNPLAAVYLGLQQLNQQVTLYSTVTQSSVYTTTETVYHTKVVSFYDGRRTRSRTLSESLSTTEKTLTSFSTAVVPYINTQALQLQQLQQQQLQRLIATQLPQLTKPMPQFSTVTSTYTTVTTATSYSSKIYTLIYNAFSTRFRTVTSSSAYKTTLTVTSTSSYQIQPTTAAPLLPQLAPLGQLLAAP
uniref:Putative mucin-5ac n=1 Tax=Ixodes ricinus TaxID=34613 RepID=A0A147BBJ4_IXORI